MVQVVVGLVFLTVINHFAPQPAAVGIDAIVEAAALLFPVQTQIQTTVVLLTHALVGHGDTDNSRHIRRVDEDVAAVLQEALHIHTQALFEELIVQAEGDLAGKLGRQDKGRQTTLSLSAAAGAINEVEALATTISLAPQIVGEVVVHTRHAGRCIGLDVGLFQDDAGQAYGRVPVEALAALQIGRAGVVHHRVGKDAVVPVITHRAQDFLRLGGGVLLVLNPGTLTVGHMGLGVVLAKVVFPVQTALDLEPHLEAAEPVAVGNVLGIGTIVLLLGHQIGGVAVTGIVVHHLAVLPVLVGHLGHFTQVVKGDGSIGVQARDYHTQVLAQGHVGQHLGLGVLVVTGLFQKGHRVHGAFECASTVCSVGLLDRESRSGQSVQDFLYLVGGAAHGVGLVALLQAGHHTNLHGGVVGNVHVYVGADAQTVVVGFGVVAIVGRGLFIKGVVL